MAKLPNLKPLLRVRRITSAGGHLRQTITAGATWLNDIRRARLVSRMIGMYITNSTGDEDHPEFKDFDFHDPSNLQGVKGLRADVNIHQQITNEWGRFPCAESKCNTC